MKTFYTFALAMALAVVGHLLNGWFWLMGYELGIMPFIEHIGYVAPTIPYLMFVLLCATRSLLKSKPVANEALTFDNPKFWTRYLSAIATDFLALFILWILNLIIL